MSVSSDHRDPDIFLDFCEEARRHGVVRLVSIEGDASRQAVTLGQTPPLRISPAPIFDMGYLRDLSTGMSLDLDLYNSLLVEGGELVNAGGFRLPFPDCWFTIWFSDADGSRYETVNLLHAIQLDDSGSLQVVTYFKCFGAPGEMGKWTQAPIQMVWLTGLGWAAVTDTHFASDHWYKERKADAEVAFSNVLVSTLVLARRPDPPEGEPTPMLERINAGRARGGLAPLPPVRIIDLTVFRSAPALEGTGSAKRPHDRRGHYRTLATGRVVPVRASRIHGGSETPPAYMVRY